MTTPDVARAASTADLDGLAARLTGTLVRPGDAGYDEGRIVMNAAIDRRPAAIAQVAGAADVAAAVDFARDHGLEVAVRSGGHSIAGHGTTDGGLLIDLGRLTDIEIDPDRGIATAGGGVTAGAYSEAAFAHGLATPFGDSASVGIGGITLGGGVGWLSRRRGMTIDHLVEVELVTADGRILTVNETEHPDLFWALRGGGGNFGVATRFTFRVEPIGMVLGGAVFLPLTREVVRGLVDIAHAAPDELTVIAAVMRVPPLPFIAPEHHFVPAVAALLVYDGDPVEGEPVVAPIRRLAEPIADVIGPMPYPAIFELTADAGERAPLAVRALLLDELTDGAIDAIVTGAPDAPSPMAMTQIRVLGGAVSRVPSDATAYAHRDKGVLVAALTIYPDPAEREGVERWTAGYIESIQAAGEGASTYDNYVNFVGDEGDDGIRASYPSATYERLREIKRRYDPANVFRLNQNIAP
jgi:FAD/FMN-containing dehydrogenase